MASKIALLEDEVARLSKLPFNKVPLKEITEEARINYENLREIGFSSIIKTNFKTSDTLAVFLVKWSDSISSNIKKEDQAKLTRWLKYKLNTDKLTVQELEK
jgi:hypothetical protein